MEEYKKHRLETKFKVAKTIYNTILGEALRRHRKVKYDKEYQSLLKKPSSAERNQSLKDLRQRYKFSEYDLHEYAVKPKHHFEGHLGINEVQKLATRAFQAVEKVHYGQAKKVYFKSHRDNISVENKTNTTGLRFQEGSIIWGNKPTKKVPKPKNWINIPLDLYNIDPYIQFALMDKTKYIRIVMRNIRGKNRYFVHLIQEGIPPAKERVVGDSNSRVGLDIGTSTIAISSDKEVQICELSPEINNKEKQLRRIERAMDRSRKSCNPENFEANGQPKKGAKIWTYSNRYMKLRDERKEIHRQLAAIRKQSHEKLANQILSLGTDIRVETMRFKALQKRAKTITYNRENGKINSKKRFGKSINKRAPSKLLSIISRKLGYEGLKLKKIETNKVRASQLNHLTKEYKKKLLSERWNELEDIKVQRDLYSAFLIQNTTEGLNAVDIDLCRQKWDSFVKLHDQEVTRLKESGSKVLKWFVS